MTYKEALDIEAQHILDYGYIFDNDDVIAKLQSLKIYMLAVVDGFGEEEAGSLDEDELFERKLKWV